MNFPVTAAIRMLRQYKIEFEPFLFEYLEKGGTKHSSEVLGVEEHRIIKTLVFETNENNGLLILQHGDARVSNKELARKLCVKRVSPVSPQKAMVLTGYLFGGTSPFGTKSDIPIYAEYSIFDLDRIFINGGKRGFLVALNPNDIKIALDIREINVKL